jgi:hypothetical protein
MTKFGLLTGYCVAGALSAGLIVAAVDAADARSGRDCRQEWRTNRAELRQQGKSRRSFMRACRTDKMTPQTAPATRTQ